MKKFTLHLTVWCALIPSLVKAQDKKWFVEAGPYVGISAWTLSVGHSLGIGADARIARDLWDNFSGGGKITYGYFFGKKIGDAKIPGVSLMGFYANLQYTHEGKYVIGGDAGLGYSFGGGESVTGFARTGYLGYQFTRDGRLFTIAAYLNRTTLATYNIGVRGWMRF